MKKTILFVCIAVARLLCVAGAAADDGQYWNKLTLQHNLNSKWETHLALHSRVVNNFSDPRVYYTAPGFLFHLSQRFAFGLNYKLQRVKVKSGWTNEHRIEIQPLLAKWTWDKLRLSWRNRLEYRNIEGAVEWRLRERLELKRALNWRGVEFSPFLAEEVFYSFRMGDFDQNRLSLGIAKKITSALTLDVFYMHKRNNRRGSQFSEHILETDFKINF